MSYTIDGRYVIVLGDKTTHGGEVITGSGNHTYFGKPVARVLDKVFCPKCGGVYEITEGAANAFDHGNRIAVDGCHTSCGAQLIAGFTRDQEAHVGAQAPAHAAMPASNATARSNWVSFIFRGLGHCEGLPCTCYFSDGTVKEGTFDAQNTVFFKNVPDSARCKKLDVVVEKTQIASATNNILDTLG